MVLLIILALFVAFAVLAMVYGSDSRDSMRSHEHELSKHGMTW